MNRRLIACAVLLLTLTLQVPPRAATGGDDPNRYLNAVQEFADNVLKYGRDTYGPKHTPLFVDGLNIHTHEPVKWKSPKGNVLHATEYNEWILSNFASQQVLMRTLDGLSSLTGDSQYRDVAKQAIAYVFENLRSPNGLIYWGQVAAYDAQADRAIVEDRDYYQPAYGFSHSFKFTYPHYELMWQVNPQATQKFIEAFWSAHILDWSNLDMNRGVSFNGTFEQPWNHEYKGGPVPFQTPYEYTGAFFNTGSILAYSGASLAKLSGEDKPLIWTKRLVQRYIDTRDPNTGISAYVYNHSTLRSRSFPLIPFQYRFLDYPEERHVHPWLSVLLTGEMLGEKGQPLIRWVIEEMTAWGKASYRKKDNSFVPILIDGTNLEGYIEEESPPGLNVAEPCPADPQYFWAYCVAYHATSDSYMWEMVRDIAVGNELGDVGRTPSDTPELRIHTDCSYPYVLLGFLQLHEKTGKSEFLEMARRIGDNILLNRRNKGFFVPSKKHVYTMFDCREPLALLHLEARLHARTESIPTVWPSLAKYIAPYRFKPLGVDSVLIYTLTDSNEPAFSLPEAASIGNVDLVKSLIESGAALESVGHKGAPTALQRAAINGHKDVVELLLAHHNRIDLQGDGSSPLHYAVRYDHKDIAELLLAHGADVNAKDNWGAGRTPIDIAMRHARMDIASLLIDNGAEASFFTKMRVNMARQERRPVDLSLLTDAQNGEQQEVKALLDQGADINAKDDQGMTPLHLAAQGGHKDVVEFLLSKDADINAQNIKGYTPLYSAIWKNDPNMVGLLVSKGADVNFSPEDDYSPLHHAVWTENVDIVKVLVDNGADCDVKDKDGWTAFRYAADEANREIIELFVANGADVSGIHRAACLGNVARVEALLEQGTDIDEKDEAGWTPLYWACSMGQEAVAEFLLSKGAQADAKTERENTPLQAACYSGDFRLVELLVSKGADVNAKDKFGGTPLHSAATAGSREIVELLIGKGGDVNAKNQANWTPLHHAAIGGHKDVAKFLISHGADTTVKDNRGRTALDLAEQRGHTEIVELLRKEVQVHHVGVTSVSVPSSCVQGDSVFITIALDNQGDSGESCVVTAIDATDGSEISHQAVTAHSKHWTAAEASLTFDGENQGDRFASQMDVGDVNGDGYADLYLLKLTDFRPRGVFPGGG